MLDRSGSSPKTEVRWPIHERVAIVDMSSEVFGQVSELVIRKAKEDSTKGSKIADLV